MLTVPELTPQVLYIEPVVHPEYLCRAVHTDGVIYCRKTSERWIDETLVYFYSSSIKVRRQNVKLIHNIHKLQPIIIDEKYQFVFFPLESCKYKNPFFVNLRQLIDFKLVDGKLIIIFIDGREVETDFDYQFSRKQYEKTLFILDRTVKHQNALRKYYSDREG
ncbi:hypothetical protein GCM10007275_08980 [Jeotgalicoccus coquinae]|uniref:ComK protein n=1 Tax=Jeotgalicoccus coquinae TaxID=709509 RepID=A0A6V7RKK4_9STAP|nr:competence protein ComK [Jeotgalicoccus coquinae]MBB6422434.1 competence protein ComK [Jeotgalicoccus coquinae]GGE15877.1 hypothetical protein GCM10007275_08980 [Jeotgalicoccus coquinae]CAD2078637.1 ComK protein [Jeotgalicoccus coquinae]